MEYITYLPHLGRLTNLSEPSRLLAGPGTSRASEELQQTGFRIVSVDGTLPAVGPPTLKSFSGGNSWGGQVGRKRLVSAQAATVGSPDSSQFIDRHGRDSRTLNAYRQVRYEKLAGWEGPNVKRVCNRAHQKFSIIFIYPSLPAVRFLFTSLSMFLLNLLILPTPSTL